MARQAGILHNRVASEPRYICLKRCTYGSLTGSVSLRCLSLTRRWPPMSRVHPGDRVDIDQRAAVDLPERLRVELLDELLDRPADQRFLLRRDDQRVLVVGLEVADLVDGDQAQLVALRRGDPAQVFLAPSTLPASNLQQAIEIGGRAREPCP